MTLSNEHQRSDRQHRNGAESPVPQQNEPKNAAIGECRGRVKCESKRCRRGRGIPLPGATIASERITKWQSEPAWYRLVFNDQNGRSDNMRRPAR